MTKKELDDALRQANVPSDAYSLDGGHPNEAYVLSHEGSGWSVYYSERGLETGRRDFTSESEACEEILKRLLRDATNRARP